MDKKNKPIDLASLYPKAKTYDELESDRERSEQIRAARMPKYPRLRIAAKIMFAIAVAVIFISIIPGLIMTNLMAGVFFSFLLVIVWSCLIWWMFA